MGEATGGQSLTSYGTGSQSKKVQETWETQCVKGEHSGRCACGDEVQNRAVPVPCGCAGKDKGPRGEHCADRPWRVTAGRAGQGAVRAVLLRSRALRL